MITKKLNKKNLSKNFQIIKKNQMKYGLNIVDCSREQRVKTMNSSKFGFKDSKPCMNNSSFREHRLLSLRIMNNIN